jgi:N-acetylneuraminic acid mutarotase
MIICRGASAQTGEWAWMGGINVVSDPEVAYAGQAGVCGTKGVPAPANLPGSREYSVKWTDPNGHFWLFGGYGYDCFGIASELNDLWEFDPATDQWAWMTGSSAVTVNDNLGQPGVYGKLGVPAPGNTPGGREYAAAWIDKSGHLWLFGGLGLDANDNFDKLNDLWEFDTATSEWTWMGGVSADPNFPVGQSPVYGTLHVPAAGNNPGGRAQAAAWTDNAGQFWLFSGGGGGNDLWEYFPSTNEWAWMGGSNSLENGNGPPAVYGTLGKPAAGNNPGRRSWAVTWTDSNGRLWLFGGAGEDDAGDGENLNDLWEYFPSTNEWAWMGGGNSSGGNACYGPAGVYGKRGEAAKGNVPGARWGSVGWVDKGGKFWLFGGNGCDSSGITLGDLNDLWEFDPTTMEWTWWDGSSTDSDPPFGNSGSYGALGVPGKGSFPGSRDSAAVWTDSAGHLWLFAGYGTDSKGYAGSLDDMWEYSPSGILPQAVSPFFNPPSGDYVAGQTVTISEFTPGADVHYTLDGSPPTNSSPRYSSPVVIERTTTVTAFAAGPGFVASSPAAATYTILGRAAAPVIAPAAGTYASEQSVTLSSTDPGATIYYTLDGSTPTAASAVYKTPLKVSESATVQAFATAPGLAASQVSSTAYTIHEPAAWANEWIWMGGSSQKSEAGVYGMLGITAAANLPGAREAAQSWIDADGHIWVFGGNGEDRFGHVGFLNDLWEFDPASNLWTWMGGQSAVSHNGYSSPVYGTLGVPAPGNTPGGLGGAATWTDKSGNFWLFGGYGNQVLSFKPGIVVCQLNDLWKFDPSTNEWTWMGGSPAVPIPKGNSSTCGVAGVYGNLGTPSEASFPGSRTGAAAWTDNDGNLWLFGGGGEDSVGISGALNDLWEFNPSIRMWTWMAGNNRLPSRCDLADSGGCGWSGVYGKQGIASKANLPGGRSGAATWTDKNGILWLFGGGGLAATGAGDLNDLWTLDPSTHEWTWVGGPSTITCTDWAPPPAFGGHFCGQLGSYGTLGVPDAANHPGGRSPAARWMDSSGDFWIYGGNAFDFPGTVIPGLPGSDLPGLGVDKTGEFWGLVNDLWKYNPSTGKWTWMGGDNKTENCYVINDLASVLDVVCAGPPGVTGTLGNPGAGNTPGNRFTTAGRADKDGNFWLFSGSVYTTDLDDIEVSDLWELEPSTAVLPPAVAPQLGVPAGAYTTGGPLTIYESMKNASIYYTTDGTTPTANSKLYKSTLTIASTLTVKAIAISPGYRNSGVVSATYTILPPAATPTFSVPGGTYSSPQTVKISDTTPGATILYTTDGVTAHIYSGPIAISTTTTLSAEADANGYSPSRIATATYTINSKSSAFANRASQGADGSHHPVMAPTTAPRPTSGSGSSSCPAMVSGIWSGQTTTSPWSTISPLFRLPDSAPITGARECTRLN